jgi:hypothetical protein
MIADAIVLASPSSTTYCNRSNVKGDPEVDYTKEVLEVLKNRVLTSLLEASESSIKGAATSKDRNRSVRSI